MLIQFQSQRSLAQKKIQNHALSQIHAQSLLRKKNHVMNLSQSQHQFATNPKNHHVLLFSSLKDSLPKTNSHKSLKMQM